MNLEFFADDPNLIVRLFARNINVDKVLNLMALPENKNKAIYIYALPGTGQTEGTDITVYPTGASA